MKLRDLNPAVHKLQPDPMKGQCLVVCLNNKRVIVTGVKGLKLANQIKKDLVDNPKRTLEILANNLSQYAKLTKFGQELHNAMKNGPLASAPPVPPRPVQPKSATDPKTEAFINIAKSLGYDVTDLHDMHDGLKSWIADLIDASHELDDTGHSEALDCLQGASPSKEVVEAMHKKRKQGSQQTFATPYGTPVQPSTPKGDTESSYDSWDRLAGKAEPMDSWDVLAGKKAKPKQSTGEWKPDTLDPNVDPLKRV